MMARTEREKLACEALERAILESRDAYAEAHPEAQCGVLTDWIVVAAELVAGESGDPDEDVATYSILMPGGGIPGYRAAGLLKVGMEYVLPGGGD